LPSDHRSRGEQGDLNSSHRYSSDIETLRAARFDDRDVGAKQSGLVDWINNDAWGRNVAGGVALSLIISPLAGLLRLGIHRAFRPVLREPVRSVGSISASTSDKRAASGDAALVAVELRAANVRAIT
jgi:hypothetical protein